MRKWKVLQNNQGPLQIFPPLVWKYNYNFDWDLLKPKIDHLLTLVSTNSELEKGDAISSVTLPQNIQPHGWAELRTFQHWLGEKIDHIRGVNQFKMNHSEVSQSWVNRHGPSGITVEHSHSFSTFVVACYLQCPKDSGYIEFKDPLEYHKSSWPVVPEESLYFEVPVQTNDVVIFPGWIKHRSQPNLSNSDRYVLTFNIK